MRPRITKAKLRGGFLGDEFVGGFDNRAKWITQLAGVFPVGVVDAPELATRLRSHGCAHGRSSPQATFVKMYQLHNMRGQSAQWPKRGLDETTLSPASNRRRVRETLPPHLQDELPRDRGHRAAGRGRLPQPRLREQTQDLPDASLQNHAPEAVHDFVGDRKSVV